MRPAKIAAIVGGVLLVIIGLALFVPGGFLLWAHGTQRDSAGFYETSSHVLSTGAYALTTPDVDLDAEPWNWRWIPKGATAAVRIGAESTSSAPLFIGIGPTDRVSQYLAGVAHDEVNDFSPWFKSIEYRYIDGGAPRSAPGEQDFWVVAQEGSGPQAVEWQVQGGNWTAVIMNADGSAQVAASVGFGARFGVLLYIALGLMVAGAFLLAVGTVLIVLGVRRPRSSYSVPQAPPPGHSPEARPIGTNVSG